MAATTIQQHVIVALRLAKRDSAAIDEIANTQAAFWYSFQAALITLPMLLLTSALEAEGGFSFSGLVGDVGLFVVGWLLYPVVMLEIASAIDRMQHYYRYIAASNWCNIFQDGLLTLVVVLRSLGIIPEALSGLAFFVSVIWVFAYQFFVARHGLQVNANIAAMLIGVRLVLSMVLFIVHSAIAG